MQSSIRRVWRPLRCAEMGLFPGDRIVELADGCWLALRGVGPSSRGFALTGLVERGDAVRPADGACT